MHREEIRISFSYCVSLSAIVKVQKLSGYYKLIDLFATRVDLESVVYISCACACCIMFTISSLK